MKQYKSVAALKGAAKTHMFGNYGPAIGAYILMNLVLLMLTSTVASVVPDGGVGDVIYYVCVALVSVLSGVFTAGNTFIYLNIASGRPVHSNMIFYGFRACAEKALLVQAFILGMEILVSLPLIVFMVIGRMSGNEGSMIIFMVIGGIIAVIGIVLVSLIFMPAFYLIHDFPDYSVRQILETCTLIMRGQVGRLFLINLSILPMQLLGLLSFGIGNLWVETYKNEVWAEFFLDLMKPEVIVEERGN